MHAASRARHRRGSARCSEQNHVQKNELLETQADDLRKLMLREPRGYPSVNCNLMLPPTNPEADAGFIIVEQLEYPPLYACCRGGLSTHYCAQPSIYTVFHLLFRSLDGRGASHSCSS